MSGKVSEELLDCWIAKKKNIYISSNTLFLAKAGLTNERKVIEELLLKLGRIEDAENQVSEHGEKVEYTYGSDKFKACTLTEH